MGGSSKESPVKHAMKDMQLTLKDNENLVLRSKKDGRGLGKCTNQAWVRKSRRRKSKVHMEEG